ncbi:uncharacterized protein TNCV_2994491 [Trichonephila clavipes]|nr:uncharacterized protein TNCV_2994491 [Trichonephila clavipes]
MKTKETFTNVSPILIEKAVSSTVATVKTIRKIRSVDSLLETGIILANLHKLAHLDVTVAPHGSLNFLRGVISPADFLNVPSEEILENLRPQKACGVRRITIRRNGQVINTKHLILTFSTPDLPQLIKATYIHCPVRQYIPNPLLCFQCQRYGHSKNVCRDQPTCPRWRGVDNAVINVTNAIMKAADAEISKTSNSNRKLCKPWWNPACYQDKKKNKGKLGVFSGGTPPLKIS